MMRQYELVERVMSYDPDADEQLLNRAYVYAMKAHGEQVRASGDPYFSHPLEVAAILTKLRLDDATIVAALLHDTVEDTEATSQEIEELFGAEIAALVDGLTKISRLDLISKEAQQGENLRKLLVAMSKDVRVLLVKLADRMHNMRTLEFMRPDKRQRIAQETLDIYAPLAGRMGMQAFRDELEDISFHTLNLEAYQTISDRLDILNKQSADLLNTIEAAFTELFKKHGLEVSMQGRMKKPYSIWRKMERKQISLQQVADLLGYRVIVEDVDACYRALGVVHQNWQAIPGRFKDYISVPKQNDYRSLHSTVIGPQHHLVELQFRTQEMNEVAEYGVAAHGFYKYADQMQDSDIGVRVPASTSNAYRWLRLLVERVSTSDHPKDFLEHTKLELFQDQVLCLTPKGLLISLPRGANAIDFAYAVHTDLGNSCSSCNINGTHAPLLGELKTGEVVEIIRGTTNTPPAAWEAMVVTGKARAAIRRATREAVRAQYAGLGRDMIERGLKRIDKKTSDKDLKKAAPRLGHNELDDALTAIGRGEFPVDDMIRALGHTPEPEQIDGEGNSKIIMSLGFEPLAKVQMRGIPKQLPVRISQYTGAVPGERIVGVISPEKGVVIYPIFSRKLMDFEDKMERWLDITWDETGEADFYPARLNVMIRNEIGALAQVTQAIGECDANIDSLQMDNRAKDSFHIDLVIEVNDVKHLARVMTALKGQDLVSTVERATG